MDRSVQAQEGAVKARLLEMTEEEERLLARLQALRENKAAERERLRHLEESAAPRRRPNTVPVATWRRTVRELGTFTVSELANELGCTPATARNHLQTMLDMTMVKPAGKAFGKAVYEYVKPTEAGVAFTAQQAHRMQEPAPEVVAVAERGGQAATGFMERARRSIVPEVWRVVVEACDAGWKLGEGSGEHSFYLQRPGARRVFIVSSPRNKGAAAQQLRQRLRRIGREALRAAS